MQHIATWLGLRRRDGGVRRGAEAVGRPLVLRFMPQSNGPYLSYAVVCEKALHETDGVVSLIRLIDRVSVSVPESDGDLAPPVAVTIAIGVKSGGFRGETRVGLRVETPNSLVWPEFEAPMQLDGGESGGAIALGLQFPAREEGLYWFVVEIGDEEATRVPLRVVRQVVPLPAPPYSD